MYKPLLAGTLKCPEALRFPLYASPKLDGIRAIVRDGKLFSRNLKLIPNRWCQSLFAHEDYEGFDGELIVGPAYAHDTYNKTSSGVMSHDGRPDVTFFVFDDARIAVRNETYKRRLEGVVDRIYERSGIHPSVVDVEQRVINNVDELDAFEAECLLAGYEGIMVRSMNGVYKHGRSTEREQILLKVKRFTDGEALIIGMEELMHNSNELETNELGGAKRSSVQANMVPMGTMGAFKVRDVKTGVDFDIGTGFKQAERKVYWDNQPKYVGKIVKYKHFEVGAKDKPRFPVFLGFRDLIDF